MKLGFWTHMQSSSKKLYVARDLRELQDEFFAVIIVASQGFEELEARSIIFTN